MASVIVLLFLIFAVISSFFSGTLAVAFLLFAALLPVTDLLVSAIRLKNPLKIKTPDGSNEPFHPSVVFFDEGWSGYRYWMAFTPYPVFKPPYRDRWECPTVVASNDGVQWLYPDTCSFLDDLTEEQIQARHYFSDTHLTYDKEKNKLYCYYRINEGETPEAVTIFRRESADGRNWSEKTPLVYKQEIERLEPLSQCVICRENNFAMWYVAHSGTPNTIFVADATDGINWHNNRECRLTGMKVTPLHIDVQYIDGYYYLVVYELNQKISLWKSVDGENFEFIKILLTIPKFGNSGLFYNNILYRACLVKTDENYKLFVSCGNKKKNCIGLMQGEDLLNMKMAVLPGKKPVKMLTYDLLSKYTYLERLVLHKVKSFMKG